MEQFSTMFLSFIDTWGYVAVAVLMGLENACIPIPSELILGFAGYLISAGRMEFFHATVAGMIGGMVGSIVTYYVGSHGGRPFIDRYGKYFFMKKSHVDTAQRWFDRYGIKAVFFSRLLPVVRTFISLPAGFARVRQKAAPAQRCAAAGAACVRSVRLIPWSGTGFRSRDSTPYVSP